MITLWFRSMGGGGVARIGEIVSVTLVLLGFGSSG